MANKYLKYIAVLITSLCLSTGFAFSQTDTPQSSEDSAASGSEDIDSSVTSAPHLNEATEKTGVDKFATRQPQAIITERKLPDTAIQKIKSDKDFWYANKKAGAERKTSEDEEESTWDRLRDSPTFNFIFWAILAGAFVAILTLYLINSKIWIVARGAKKITDPETAGEDMSEDIFIADFDVQISRAVNAGNYRLATRLLFLRLLRSMSEKSIIQYSKDKTNMDYMFELGNSKYFRGFVQASRTYEYVWYGNFDIQQSQFLQIKQSLDELNQKIRN